MKSLTEEKKHEICKIAIAYKTNIESSFIELGGMLYEIKEQRLFEAGWGSWDDFTMELGLSTATISRLIGIHREFVLRYEIPPMMIAEAGGWSVVAQYLPLIALDTPQSQVKEWLATASQLTRADVRRGIQEAKTGVDMGKCKHKDTYKLQICRDCKDRWEI